MGTKSIAAIRESLLRVSVVLFPWIKPDITLDILVPQKTLNTLQMNKIELIENLRLLDEITLMELLNLTSDDLVDAFLDKITENQGKLIQFIYDN